MLCDRVSWSRLALLTFFSAGIAAAAIHPGPSFASGNPCEAVGFIPDPPIKDPDPEIAGAITDAGTGSPISGVTMKLYRCIGNTALQVATSTTDVAGHYVFSSLPSERWYYVEAVASGPLAGRSPAPDTSNPSAAIGIGESATGVDFGFQ